MISTKHLALNLNRFIVLGLILLMSIMVGQPGVRFVTPSTRLTTTAATTLPAGSLPLIFAPTGDRAIPVSAFGASGTIGFQPTAVTVSLPHSQRLQVSFVEANPNTALQPVDQRAGVIRRYSGTDATRWQTEIPTFAGVIYQGLYPGIDLHYAGRAGSLKGTYTLTAGADPTRILWRYDEAQQVMLDAKSGDLHITLPDGQTLVERAPVAWQERNGQQLPVTAHFTLRGNEAGFALGTYDSTLPLVIDPTLIFGTFAGGNSADYARGIAIDAQGNVYVVGDTLSTTFFGSAIEASGSNDVIVLKLNPTASDLVYGLIVGGKNYDEGLGIAVNQQGEAYVTISADSTDFPIMNARYPDRPDDNQGVLLKLTAAGEIAYSTWLPFGMGNSISGQNVAVDSQGNVIVTGEFYVALHISRNLAVIKLNPAGTQTLLDKRWESGGERGSAVAIGPDDAIYLTGNISNRFPNFPVTANALQSKCGRQLALGDDRDCDDDAFLVILDASGTVTYASYLGGYGSDRGNGIAVDADGNIIITGDTDAADFPTTTGSVLPTCKVDQSLGGCYYDSFVTKFAPGGTAIEWSTYLNSDELNVLDFAKGVAVDAQGNIYVTGYTAGTHFPTKNAIQNSLSLGNCTGGFTRFCFDAYLTAFTPDGSLIYSTYLGDTRDEYAGGLAVDGQRNVYLTGYSYSMFFPTTSGVIQPHADLGADFYIAKIGTASGGGGGNLSNKVYLPLVIR